MIEYLKQIGGDVVMTDELASSHLGRGVLADMPAPKLAINAVGGESSSLLVKMLGYEFYFLVVVKNEFTTRVFCPPLSVWYFVAISLISFSFETARTESW